MQRSLLAHCAYVLVAFFPVVSPAQSVQWASTVVEFSSQYSDEASSAKQILGKPNVLPSTMDSPQAWATGEVRDDGKTHEPDGQQYIIVGFANPQSIRQVAVAESFNPGAIERITLIDQSSDKHVVYEQTPAGVDVKGRMLNVIFPLTSFRVVAVRIDFQPGMVSGWNEIDAVGISDSPDSVKATIHLAAGLAHVGKAEHLGPNVNTQYTDLSPLISPDGQTLYFARKHDPSAIGGITPSGNEDIYFSVRDASGQWGPAQNIGRPLNNSGANAIAGITPDGNTILLINHYTADGEPNGPGFSFSHRTATGWSVPEDINIPHYYNHGKYVEVCMSSDASVILFTAQRDDALGERDIYVTFKKENGEWTEPQDLGDQVCTVGDETSPFLAADGVTLYYASTGMSGYGMDDLFVTRRLDSTWKHWSEPENLGPDINTPDFDAYYTFSASGDYAYFSRVPENDSAADIFRIELPAALKPKPVVLVAGVVYNAKTKKPIEAIIKYDALTSGTGAKSGTARSNPNSGAYEIVLPAGTNYGFHAEAKGYYAVSENVNTAALGAYKEVHKDLFLAPIEVGSTIRLNNIFFESGKAELKPESFPELNRVAALLKENEGMHIEVSGHTDNVGSDATNLTLSKDRAGSVAVYIVGQGIDRKRLTAKGYGKSKPVATNDNDEGRQMNRRVEFTIMQ